VWAFDAETGEELWRAAPENGSNLVSAAVVTEGRILALDAFGGVVALHAEDGRTLWRTEVINPLTQAQPFSLGDVSAPVAGEGQVFAADVTGRVYAFDADTGALRWDFALNEANRFSPPVLTDEHVLVATESGLLAAIDRSTGHLAWRVDAGADVLRGLADGGEQIVGVTGIEDAGVVAFAADPERPLLDEPSPTTVNLGELAVGFALGGLLVGLIALALARPLHRRLGPATPSDAGPVEESG
jgi:outer membrane protein assembly factor BamB